jgi:hypothetical protein
MRGQHLFTLPKAAIDETRARLGAKLPPHFLFAGAKPFSEGVHNVFENNRDEGSARFTRGNGTEVRATISIITSSYFGPDGTTGS